MGSKRGYSDFDAEEPEIDADGVHRDRRAFVPEDKGPSAKKLKSDGTRKHKAKEGSTEYSRKRIRAIERLFQRNQDLPADVRNNMERELASHKATIVDKSHQKKRSAMISKYHMVRFFERKKASRLAKQLRTKIENNDDPTELESLREQLHIAEVDEAYTQHHPHAEPYISLYTKTKPGQDDETPIAKAALEAERPPIWAVVEKTMKDGPEALRRLRERRSPEGSMAVKKAPAKRPLKKPEAPALKPAERQNKPAANQAAAPQKGKGQPAKELNRRERRKLEREAAEARKDKDSGDGFFEL